MSAFVQTLACHQYSAKSISSIGSLETHSNYLQNVWFFIKEDAFVYADSLVQDCEISIANALEAPQSCIY